MADTVLFEADATGVVTLTLNRPEALNALDEAMVDGLEAALDRLEENAERARVVVIAGAGRGFMAGGDVKWFAREADQPAAQRAVRFERFIHRAHPIIVRLRRLALPVVASVHGPVAGFGLSLLFVADLAVAGDDAVFTLAYRHIGTSPDGGSTFFLPRLVGAKKAAEIALLGERFGAAEALRIGIVNAVVPTADLAGHTAALAAKLAAGPALALANTKRLLATSLDHPLETQLQREAESFAACAATEDFAEGARAFVEKRAPRFGR